MTIPLLDAIDIQDKTITADASLTQRELADYLNFPHVGQAFVIERHSIDKKTGESSSEIAYGITSQSPQKADAQRVLATNRGHWSIENSCHYI
jgi:hypothetical protein